MILVNDIWLSVQDLDDVASVVRDYYNPDLADIIEKLIPEHTDEEYEELESNLRDLEDNLSIIEDELAVVDNHNDILEEKIEVLEEENKNLKKRLKDKEL